MGDFRPNRSYIYIAGALIEADKHNINENTLYTTATDLVNSTTGHGHTGSTGDGPQLLGTGIANNAINFNHLDWGVGAGQIDGTETTTWKISKDATYSLTLAHATLTASRTITFPNDDATMVGVATTQTLSNKTFSDRTTFQNGVSITSGSLTLDSGNFSVATTKNIYLDGENDTYLTEAAGNDARLYVGGTSRYLRVVNTAGTQTTVASVNTNTNAIARLGVINDVRSYFWEVDGGISDYLQLVSETGGIPVDVWTVTTGGELLLPAVDPPASNYIGRRSGVKAYIKVGTGSSPATVYASYNIDGAPTKSGTGVIAGAFNTDFSSAHYACTGTVDDNAATGYMVKVNSASASTFEIRIIDHANTPTDAVAGAAFFGDQA